MSLTCVITACVAATALRAESGVAIPVEGQPFAASLAGIDDSWSLRFETEDGPRELPAAELVRWGTAPELNGEPIIVLADGGLLIGEVREIEGEHVAVNSFLFGDVRLPLSRVRGIVFHPPAERLERERLLDRMATAEGSRDRLLLENGDVVEGLLAGGGRRGVQGPPAPQETPQLETLRMQVDDGVAEVPLERIEALVFNPSLVEAPAAGGRRAWVGFEDDGLLLVDRVESQSGLTTLVLPGGMRVRTDDEGFRDSAQLVQPIGGAAVYLSDLEPLGYRHIPYLTLSWEYGRDRNVLGGRLRSGARTYLKGLGMHSTSRLAYRLEEKYERFEAELALDDAAGREGSVIYRIYTAGASGEWTPVFESPLVRGGDPPLPILVEVSGARAMALIVEYADRGDVQDYANWLDARLEL
ncbi:MAG: NPCBM/NEW2 domain-containing protein [Planctomycetes bacterium]|nr:NPCBM/NEW2 domain-containing protein [Planctomycetota bacterium]